MKVVSRFLFRTGAPLRKSFYWMLSNKMDLEIGRTLQHMWWQRHREVCTCTCVVFCLTILYNIIHACTCKHYVYINVQALVHISILYTVIIPGNIIILHCVLHCREQGALQWDIHQWHHWRRWEAACVCTCKKEGSGWSLLIFVINLLFRLHSIKPPRHCTGGLRRRR